MFKGTYRYKIDPKGRLPLPAPFRRALAEAGGGTLVLTRIDQCLAAFPLSEWRRVETQLGALPAFSKPVKALTRLLTSGAADCELDTQGRILLPSALRQAASLGRDAVVVGVLNRVEVWSPEAWDAFLRDSERLLDDAAMDFQWPIPPPPEAPRSTEPLAHERPQAKPKR